MARETFIALGIDNTTHRAGILLFVSEEERYVEIIADRGIAEHVDNHSWQEAVKLFVEDVQQGNHAQGFLDCIERCGKILEQQFPASEDEAGEQLPDVMLVIEHDHFSR